MSEIPKDDLHIVFDGPPGPGGCRFVEVETPDGRSISAGEWREMSDGYWHLIIPGRLPAAARKTEAEWLALWRAEYVVGRSSRDQFIDMLRAHGLILPNPEDDLLKEAREIAKIGGYEEDEGVVQVVLAALKKGRG